ncbi:HDIG domain-containing protein [Myxococcota bacterium]|nr:HDIG domain-containing protein [Myxococcota bacterium]MBU1432595.1 HDIG domain-containing protein [Myxococcota bacterium]MBU1896583.1 HDIG domain-containing protein [Myxococcota bacterium]
MIGVAATTIAGAALTASTLYLNHKSKHARRLQAVEAEARAALAQIHAEADASVEEATLRLAAHAEAREAEQISAEALLEEDEARLKRMEEAQARRLEHFDGVEATLEDLFERVKGRKGQLELLRAEITGMTRRQRDLLEEVAGGSQRALMEARKAELISRAEVAANKRHHGALERLSLRAEMEARALMDLSGHRHGGPLPAPRWPSTVDARPGKGLSSEVLSLISAQTGVSVEPREGGWRLSCHNTFAREQARRAMELLLRSGHSSEAHVNRALSKALTALERGAQEAGQRAIKVLKLKEMHPEIVFTVGKLLYRTSFSQNQWQHAIETAELCGMIADELGMATEEARRAALLHDLGKVLWAETEAVGSHAISGALFAVERGEAEAVRHAIIAHHGEEKPSTPLAHLVAATDALSGGRPGARRETLEAYTQRMDDLNRICEGFSEIQRAYIMHGGREVRIEVDPRWVSDQGVERLSSQVAQLIEEECVYPGQIKVMVIRERRFYATAR